MNQRIINKLLAVASLAMLAAAKLNQQRVVEVDEKMLRDMNADDDKFVMNRLETLTILMDKSAGW